MVTVAASSFLHSFVIHSSLPLANCLINSIILCASVCTHTHHLSFQFFLVVLRRQYLLSICFLSIYACSIADRTRRSMRHWDTLKTHIDWRRALENTYGYGQTISERVCVRLCSISSNVPCPFSKWIHPSMMIHTADQSTAKSNTWMDQLFYDKNLQLIVVSFVSYVMFIRCV